MKNFEGQQIGRYRIVERLGMGGMAVVYKAYDTRLERDVALKVIRTGAIPPDTYKHLMKRFEREAKSQARFDHKNIVHIYDYGEVEGSPYLVMAFVSGGTLKSQLKNKPINWRKAVRWLIPVAEALSYAHQRGVIHRDVKPANILFNEEGQPILTDFGIAKILETDEATLTSTGMGVGTPEYMAPEQWQGKASEATDQYSLGVVLYELITGKKPYQADTPAAVAILQATEPLAPPSKLVRGVPETVEKVLYKTLARNPEDRYEDMEAFQAALEGLLIEAESQKEVKARESKQQPQQVTEKVVAVRSEGETRDALDTTPLEGIRIADKPDKPRRRGLPRWAWWAGAGVIGLVVMGLMIGIVGNLVDGGKAGEGTLAMIRGDMLNENSVVTNTPTTTEIIRTNHGELKIDCMGAEEGDEITMLYQWSGVEEEKIIQILKPFVDACGVTISPESTRDQALLDARVQAGTPPDIAFWNVIQMQQYQDILFSMPKLGVIEENYPDYWKTLGSVNGEWVGLPVKADPKSLVWYSPANFDEAGYEVPDTWEGLEEIVEQMVADDRVPWSMGFESGDATGWTGTDFIQDILLVTQGPDFVRGIIGGSVPYNDPAVKAAWEMYGEWAKSEEFTIGGADGTVSIDFNNAILLVFSDPPEAMMVKQTGFAGGSISGFYPELEYGTGYAFFGVPGVQGLQGGLDWMMTFSDKAAVKALVTYLSSEAGGQKWAEVGFDLTPNLTGRGMYLNEELQDKGDILYNADDYVPDIGDSIPGGFGSAEFDGITEYIYGGNLDVILETLTQIQQEALE